MELRDVGADEYTRDSLRAKYPGFRNAFDEYYAGKQQTKKNKARRKFSKRLDHDLQTINQFISQVHHAAIMTILWLTGMRDCLKSRNGYSFLKSKVIKRRQPDGPTSEGWMAIEITLDACEILQLFCEKAGNEYLFSSPNPIYTEKKKIGYSFGILNTKLNRWIKKIDSDGLFDDWTFSVHQCRETLVYQLARRGIGLPFISMQIKHFYNRFSRMPNEVAAGYEGVQKNLLEGTRKRKAEARESVLMEVYGEDSNFAGGGEKVHKAHVDTFFSGIGYLVKIVKNRFKRWLSKASN